MIEQIKNKIIFSFDFLGKNNYIYTLISLIVLNFIFLKNCLCDSYGESILHFANDLYSILVIFGITVMITFIIVGNFQKNYAIHTRVKNTDNKFVLLFTNVVFIISVIYLTIILFYCISVYCKSGFSIGDKEYRFYNISSLRYGVWGLIRNYIYIIFLVYIIVYYSLYSNISWLVYIIISVIFGVTYLTYSYHIDGIMKLFYGYYIGYNQFSSFSFEIFNYFIYMTFKLGVVIIILRLSNFINNNFKINLNYLKYNFFNTIKVQNVFAIVMYLLCVGISIHLFGVEYPEVLFDLLAITEQPILVILCYLAITLSFIYLLMNIYLFDRNKLGDFIFTRISPSKWLIYKIIFLTILMSVIRMIIYIFSGLNIYALYDWIINFILIIECGFVSLNDNTISYVLLSLMVILIIVLDINYITIICLSLIPILNFINCKNILLKKKY